MNVKEKAFVAQVANLGCIACAIEGVFNPRVEIHHIRDGQGVAQRAGWREILPLCVRHHRIGKLSFHEGRRLFVERYGSERELLKRVYQELGEC